MCPHNGNIIILAIDVLDYSYYLKKTNGRFGMYENYKLKQHGSTVSKLPRTAAINGHLKAAGFVIKNAYLWTNKHLMDFSFQ